MDGEGRWKVGRVRWVLSGEERESQNERYIAPGKQKTIVTLPPITHFNLKQQIFFTQLISTHRSRGLGWSWAFMCFCCCKAYTSLCLSLVLHFLCISFYLFTLSKKDSASQWNTLKIGKGKHNVFLWQVHSTYKNITANNICKTRNAFKLHQD